MIALEILEHYNATLKFFSKNRIVFNELDTPQFYFQIKIGKVKMFNLTEDGKEFTQGFFEDDNSFGEPPLFGSLKYPASATTIEESEIYMLPKIDFLRLLKDNPEIHLDITKLLCKRMIYKATTMKELSIYPPEHRILTLLKYLKTTSSANNKKLYEVTLTRQQLSELTGLRVETVIRSVKKLEKPNKLSISERKIYL